MDECIHGVNPEWCGICTKVELATTSVRVGEYGFHGGRTKQELLSQLCAALGIRDHQVGRGSSLPSEVFQIAARRFRLRMGSMPEIGRALALKAGLNWGPDCDSTGSISGGGSTVTIEGLEVMIEAVKRLG